MRDTLFIWVEAYEYPSGLRIEAFLWSASIILGRFMKELFSSIILLKVKHYLFFISFFIKKDINAFFLIFDITTDKFDGFKYGLQTLIIVLTGNQVVEILTGSKSNPAIIYTLQFFCHIPNRCTVET